MQTLKNKKYWYILGVLLLTFIVFSPSLNNEFLKWDDDLQITDNKDITELNIESIINFFSTFYVGMYQPITSLTYAVNYRIAGLDAGYFHLSNILFHLINVLLVFILFSKINKDIIFTYLITIIFAIHPLQVESVSWLSARSNLIYSLFYILSLIMYIDYIKSGYKAKFYLYTVIFFILSLLSKSTAVTLPILLFAFDYYYDRKLISKKVILEKIPLLLLSIGFGIITIFARKEAEHLTELSKYYNLLERILLANYAILFYLVKFLAPIKLSAFYNYPLRSNGLLPTLYYIAPFIIIGLIYLLYKFKEYHKQILFGTGLFFIPILLVLQIIPVGSQTVTERYMYFPMLGLLFILTLFIGKLAANEKINKNILLLIIGIYIIFLGVSSYERTKIWKDTMTLFDDTLEKHPRAMTVRNLRGIEYKNNRQYELAINDFNQVIYYYPTYADAYNNRANVNRNIGNLKEAIEDYEKAIELEPGKAEIYSNKGIALAELGDINSAIQMFTKALEVDSEYVFAYTNRAKAYAMVSNYKLALRDIEFALQLNSELGLAYFIKGMIKIQQQKPGACEDLKLALKYNYSDAKMALSTYCN